MDAVQFRRSYRPDFRIGVVNTKVTEYGSGTSSGGGGSSGIYYVPITITNSNGATGSNFQQMFTINSQTYQSYINSGWSNVKFTTGPLATGSTLQAWVESGASNTATSTIVWVLFPSGIASGSTTIYMNFMTSNVMSSSGPTGEAPQLSSTYAQYDNGASVFPFYDNFYGTSLNAAKWVACDNVGAGIPAINNGITFSVTATGQAEGIYTVSAIPYPAYAEVYFSSYTGAPNNPQIEESSSSTIIGGESGTWIPI